MAVYHVLGGATSKYATSFKELIFSIGTVFLRCFLPFPSSVGVSPWSPSPRRVL